MAKAKKNKRKRGGGSGGGQGAAPGNASSGPDKTPSNPAPAAKSGAKPSKRAKTTPPEPGAVRALRLIDNAVGFVEHAALVVLVLALIGSATFQAISNNFFNKGPDWSLEVIRYSVFFIALLGASLAAQKRRMITMDLLTRAMAGRAKAAARILISVGVVGACYLLYRGGLVLRASQMTQTEHGVFISASDALLALPLAANLIGFHYVTQALTDVLYLVRGLTPPEPEGMQVH